MEKIPTWIPVVALALFDEIGRVLLQRQLPHKRHGGCWEFPGGKVETGESPRHALVREIFEELALELEDDRLAPAGFAEEPGAPAIVLILYTSREAAGIPAAQEGQEWGWFTLDQAARLNLAPMDRELLKGLAG